MISKIHIQNFKIFEKFDLDLSGGLNILVGDNEAGKSTIIEAVNLALTKRLDGKFIEYSLTPYIFNSGVVSSYLAGLEEGISQPPSCIIELYFSDGDDLQKLRGTNNSKKEDCPGVRLEIAFDEECWSEYTKLLDEAENNLVFLPTEYFKVDWRSFAGNSLNPRHIPVTASYIDATNIRLQSGADYYMQDIINNDLDELERAKLGIIYRNLKQGFSGEGAIQAINTKLAARKGGITDKDLAIGMDVSQKTGWEANLAPYLDELPLLQSGKGEQSALKVMLALERRAKKSNLILIEEPENHLSFSSMAKLISKIKEKCEGKQILLTTHSTFVLNKLGLDHLILLGGETPASLKDLPPETQDYFMKLPGYDTLRLVLSSLAILVEGASDELIVQRAYKDQAGVLPLDQEVDVISVRGLSFKRFLDIAVLLEKPVRVVTDNDGDYATKVTGKYAAYSEKEHIDIYASDDDTLPSLEEQIVSANSLADLNTVLGTEFGDEEALLSHMQRNKTDVALKIFNAPQNINYPKYIIDAVT